MGKGEKTRLARPKPSRVWIVKGKEQVFRDGDEESEYGDSYPADCYSKGDKAADVLRKYNLKHVLVVSNCLRALLDGVKEAQELATPGRIEEDAPLVDDVIAALYPVRKLLEDDLEDFGGCDHSVGVCACHIVEALRRIDEILEAREGFDRKIGGFVPK